MEAFSVSGLTFRYPHKEKKALDNVTFSVSKGDFLVICGYSGCGKTTLLRLLKPSLSPFGELSGEILFENKPLSSLSETEAAQKIGFVMQSPESQTVTDKVWHELAFSLESLGFDRETIRLRVAEVSAFFGIEKLYYSDVSKLSGGQKQIVALASVMTLRPEILILDEPTSQLDPIAAGEFISLLSKINRETGTTIILCEHRLEEAFACATKAAVMEEGKIICFGEPKEVASSLKNTKSKMFSAMPAATRIWASAEGDKQPPLTVSEGRNFLYDYTNTHTINKLQKKEPPLHGEEMISAEEVWFRYEKDLPDVLRNLNFKAYSGEILCVLGSNGGGKTTALKVLGGLRKAYRGEVRINGKTAYMPQQASTLFIRNTVLEDLYDTLKDKKLTKAECENFISEVSSLCRIKSILDCHPYDISGGEQQKAALAKMLLLSPDILLLDEPTKGLDSAYKKTFADIIINLRNSGKCIIIVSHDIEFCACLADRCALFFDGSLVIVSDTSSFFSGNSFYTTSAGRISEGIIENAIITDDILEAIGKKPESESEFIEKVPQFQVKIPESEEKKLPLIRKIGASICALASLLIMIFSSVKDSVTKLVDGQGLTAKGFYQLIVYGVFIAALILMALFLYQREKPQRVELNIKKEKLSKKSLICVSVSLILIPLTVVLGLFLLPQKQYYITSLLVITESFLSFIFVFEGQKPKAKEITVLSVLCAVGVAGRAVFFMLPQFKPVAAIVIVTGMMLGAQSGFLVGSVTMLVSNMLFSQGPWTPWQMLAMGLIGLFSGLLSQKGILRKSRISLCVFGFLSIYLIYGLIVNASTALIWAGENLNLKILLSYYITGFPMDSVHAFSTLIFLWFGAQPLIDILERVKLKYNIE